MKKIKFTKKESLIIKGLAIILMVVHHLYAFPNRIYYDYVTIYNIDNYIGAFGKICVSMFLFISGFGIYYSLNTSKKENFRKLKQRILYTYLNYWIVFFIFIPIGFILFNVNFNLKEFVENFIGFKSTYNYEWWFLRVYILLMISTVFTVNRISKYKLIAFIEIFSGYIIAIIIVRLTTNSNGYIIKELISLLRWSPCFYMGVFVAKFNIFEIASNKLKLYKFDNKIIYSIGIVLVVLLRQLFLGKEAIDSIIAPIFIFCILNLVRNAKVRGILAYLGKHSNNIWLVHTFFCYYYFQRIIFLPKFSLIITMEAILISLIVSYLINYIIKKIKTIFDKQKCVKTENIL